LLIAVGYISSAFKQIDAGTVGVTTLYGNVQTGILRSGLNVINPLLDVVDFDIRTQNYTMSSSQNEGDGMMIQYCQMTDLKLLI
jgi:regulator of protease activity HflC (stomatin/prohibitin superfamily)